MRRKRAEKRERKPDAIYSSVALSRFINYVMSDGEKNAAEKVVYSALKEIEKETKEKPIEVFEKALENVSPRVEVASRRIGGANYQVPREVRPERKFMLASRWIIEAARSKKGKPMARRLADELLAAYKNEGAAVKKKQDIHRMAESNRAFAHFSW
ncbi:MAG: 30S ribosomal protein S7 [Patescibacteria group bacterium]|nr:30S ribosomal protein S7 [Patescibacteria group bacterium]